MLNTDQAFDLLKEAGITDNPETFRRWLREGKIKATGFTIDEQSLKQLIDEHLYPDKDENEPLRQLKLKIKEKDQYIERIEELYKSSTQELIKQRDQLNKEIRILKSEHTYSNTTETIQQLKLKIKTQDQYIRGIEELHKSSTQEFIKQRDQLNKEMAILKNEQNKLRKETMDLLRENIELRNKLLELKENKKDSPHSYSASPLDHYSQKLGLSKMASNKEVLTGFKALLKLSHPDHGGNAKLFQYLKNDYDHFRKNSKG